MKKVEAKLYINSNGEAHRENVDAGKTFSYLGTIIAPINQAAFTDLCDAIEQVVDVSDAYYTAEEIAIRREEAFDFFVGMWDHVQMDFAPETITTPTKKTRVKIAKSPLFELLPQVFKGNGKVKRHPYNAKAKTSDTREIIRSATKISAMTSVIVVLPVGTLQLSHDFKSLCVNSKGESIFDLVLEEMMMQGWVIRGINLTNENSIDIE